MLRRFTLLVISQYIPRPLRGLHRCSTAAFDIFNITVQPLEGLGGPLVLYDLPIFSTWSFGGLGRIRLFFLFF